jgi:hypothetical protein
MKRLWMLIFGILIFNTKDQAFPTTSFTDSNLPIIIINTGGQTIMDEPKVMVDMGVIYNGVGMTNHVTDAYNNYSGKITIEIRGSSSQSFPQKSYGFTTVLNSGQDFNTNLLGMPSEHDWILYAPYTDKTLVRNVLTYRLANEMGLYAPRTRFCELVIDNVYQGVYVLMEKIKRDDRRVNISKLTPQDITSDQLTGGYIVKIDKTTGNGGAGWYSSYVSPNNTNYPYFQYHYPESDDITPEQQHYIHTYFHHFEDTLNAPFYADPLQGYAKFINVNSFIDFLILNEISRNVDGYRLSSFFYKDRDSTGGKITAGPVWDFNLAWWNADYCEGYNTSGWAYQFPQYCGGDGFQPPFWWDRLMQDDNFTNKLHCRWNYLRETILATSRLNNIVEGYADTLTSAQARHFTEWPILGTYVWPNPAPIASTFDGEITNLKQWILGRTTWLDNNIPGNCDNQPVLLMSFSGGCLNYSKMRLSWKTYGEKSVDSFLIQRRNETGAYVTIGDVKATNNNGHNTYHYDDAIAINDKYMYRIAIVPVSGTMDYSDPIGVKKCLLFLSTPEEIKAEEKIAVLPNPSASELFIETENQSAGIVGYDLYDITGKWTGGEKFERRNGKIPVKEAHLLRPGMYTIKIYKEDKTIVKKIIRN